MDIEQLKIEIVLKHLAGELFWKDIERLPKNDEIRTLLCSLEPRSAYLYAVHVDKKPHPETREAAHKDPYWRFLYSYFIDKEPYLEKYIEAFRE